MATGQGHRRYFGEINLERAVCIRCGLLKTSIFTVCERCGLDPSGNDVELAKSIRLSTRYREGGGEFVTVSELEVIAEQIERGAGYTFSSDEISALLNEKRLLDQGLPVTDKIRVALFILLLLLPGLLGLFYLLQ
jgi:hypothetical protein